MIKWIGILASIILLAACGSDSDESLSVDPSMSEISGKWEVQLSEPQDPTETQMKYLSIGIDGEVALFGLDPIEGCYQHELEEVSISDEGNFEIISPPNTLTLSATGDVLTIDTGLVVLQAQPSNIDFSEFNLCSEIPEPSVITLEDIQGNWEITELELSDGEVALQYFNISEENVLTSYHIDVDQNCHKMESVGKVNYISSGHFNFSISTSQIMINYEVGQLKLYEEGSEQFIYASNTSGDLSQLAICGQVAPDPDPEPNDQLTLSDIQGMWVYRTDSQSHYVSIGKDGLFKRFALDDVKECYNHLAGSVANKGNNQFTISPAGGDAVTIELTKDGDAFQSSSSLGDIEFNRSNLTEVDLTPECTEPVVIDEEMTLLKLQGSFGTLTSSGTVIGGNHLPFRFVAGSLLSFVNYDFSGGCYQRQGYWLEELGEGQFKKTEVLTGDTAIVGFISEGINVSMVNVNTGSILELGDYNSAGDYPESGSNHITRGVNLLGCKENLPVSAQLVDSWRSDDHSGSITFEWVGEKLIRTTYPTPFGCYNAPSSVEVDIDNLFVLDGSLAIRNGGRSKYYNRILEKDLPLPCDDIEPDLTLTLESVAGLWKSESEGEHYYSVTEQGSTTTYFIDRVDDTCLFKSLTSTLTPLNNGKFLESYTGFSDTQTISFLMPEVNRLTVFYGLYDRPGVDKVRSEETLDNLDSRVCEK